MVTRRSLDNYQQAGFGGLSFVTDLQWTTVPMSYEQRLWSLEGSYAFALAKIENDDKYKDDKDVGLLVAGIAIMLKQAGETYLSEFETHTSFSPLENNYRTLLCQIFEKITQLQGKIKLIEKTVVQMDEIA